MISIQYHQMSYEEFLGVFNDTDNENAANE